MHVNDKRSACKAERDGREAESKHAENKHAPVDPDGLTEQEFLADYKKQEWPKPSLTSDACIVREGDGGLEILLIRRGRHPFLGLWALPGGFVEQGETAYDAAVRELAEETGVHEGELSLVGFYSSPGRDPRGWTASAAYATIVKDPIATHAGDDAADARWFSMRADEQSDGRMALSLSAGEEMLEATFDVVTHPITGRREARNVAERGFAFDHGTICADTWLALTS